MSILHAVFGNAPWSLGNNNLSYSLAGVIVSAALRKPVSKLLASSRAKTMRKELEVTESRLKTHMTAEITRQLSGVHDRLDQQADATRAAAAPARKTAVRTPAVHHPPANPEGM